MSEGLEQRMESLRQQYAGSTAQTSSAMDQDVKYDRKSTLERLSSTPKKLAQSSTGERYAELKKQQRNLARASRAYGKLTGEWKMLFKSDDAYTFREALALIWYEKIRSTEANMDKADDIHMAAQTRTGATMDTLAAKIVEVAHERYEIAKEITAGNKGLLAKSIEHWEYLNTELIRGLRESYAAQEELSVIEADLKQNGIDMGQFKSMLEELENKRVEAHNNNQVEEAKQYVTQMEEVLGLQQTAMRQALDQQLVQGEARSKLLSAVKRTESAQKNIGANKVLYEAVQTQLEADRKMETMFELVITHQLPIFMASAELAGRQMKSHENEQYINEVMVLQDQLMDAVVGYSMAANERATQMLSEPSRDVAKMEAQMTALRESKALVRDLEAELIDTFTKANEALKGTEIEAQYEMDL